MLTSEDTVGHMSGPARKRPRPLEEAVGTGDGVALRFSESFSSDNQNLVLLQVPESLLDEIGEDADLGLVKLIGGEDEDAVLVTGGQTFKLTKAETSNTLLLVPPEGTNSSDSAGLGNGNENGESSSGGGVGSSNSGGREWAGDGTKGVEGFEAVAAVGFQFELSKKTPSLEQIRTILEACTYRGKEEEAGADREQLDRCTLAELQSRVQFSHRELLKGLEELGALCIEGRWRIVDQALMERTADAMLGVVIEEDMPLDKVDVKACVAALPDCEPLVLEHCIRMYSLPADGDQEKKNNGVSSQDAAKGEGSASSTASASYRLDLDRVARLRAHQILRKHEAEANGDGGGGGGGGGNTGHPDDEGPLPLSEFMERWATSMPGVDTPSRDLLKGIALIEKKDGKDKDKERVLYLPASGLPFKSAERLAALFQIKPKWPMAELEPYIPEADRKAGFLLKNTRFSTDPTTGLKLFSAR